MFGVDVPLHSLLAVGLEPTVLLAAGKQSPAFLPLLQVGLPPGPANTVTPHRHEVDIPDMFCLV